MLLTNDTELRVRTSLREAISLLCQTGLKYNSELSIAGLLAVTLDKKEVLLINIQEVIYEERNSVVASSASTSHKTHENYDDQIQDQDPVASSESNSALHDIADSQSSDVSSFGAFYDAHQQSLFPIHPRQNRDDRVPSTFIQKYHTPLQSQLSSQDFDVQDQLSINTKICGELAGDVETLPKCEPLDDSNHAIDWKPIIEDSHKSGSRERKHSRSLSDGRQKCRNSTYKHITNMYWKGTGNRTSVFGTNATARMHTPAGRASVDGQQKEIASTFISPASDRYLGTNLCATSPSSRHVSNIEELALCSARFSTVYGNQEIRRPKICRTKSKENVCCNCGTSKTTTWRRCPENNGLLLCNACGCYYKIHQVHRPASMATEEIRSRTRHPSIYTMNYLQGTSVISDCQQN